MTIYFGESIKRLRKHKELTQETLANFLGVSPQAVSKWERGESYPDIALIPSIAAFFGVSTDELLGVDKAAQEEKIQHYIDQYYVLLNDGDLEKMLETMKMATVEFPGNFDLLVRYFNALINTNADDENRLKIKDEMESIFDSIQNYCTTDSIRMWAKRLMCQYYSALSEIKGSGVSIEKAEKILAEMPLMQNSRDFCAPMLYRCGEKRDNACKAALAETLRLLGETAMQQFDSPLNYNLSVLESIVALFNAVLPDEDYGANYYHIVYNYGYIAVLHHAAGDDEKALESLKKCAYHAKRFDELPEISEHISPMLRGLEFMKSRGLGLGGETMCKRMKRLMLKRYPLSPEFKSSEEFKSIIESLG